MSDKERGHSTLGYEMDRNIGISKLGLMLILDAAGWLILLLLLMKSLSLLSDVLRLHSNVPQYRTQQAV